MKTHINFDKTSIGKHIDNYDGLKDVGKLGAGDSYYVKKLMKIDDKMFLDLLNEITFEQMFNFTPNAKDTDVVPIPRLVSAQTDKNLINSPHYRMPGCNQGNIPTHAWTPTVNLIREKAQVETGQELNHCVINLYFDSNDSLAFHKDNLLDLKENTGVISVSIGQTRPILFHSTETKHKQNINLVNGSLLYIGTKTNKQYVHSIPKLFDKVEPRLSLTFRCIDSFINNQDNSISGIGSLYQSHDYPFIQNHSGEKHESMKKYWEISMEKLNELKEKLIKKISLV
jgi:alkylated DNA repair dioxygenase AlkB